MLLQKSLDILNIYKDKIINIIDDDSQKIIFGDKNKQESIEIIENSINKLTEIISNEKENISILEKPTNNYYIEVQRQFSETNNSFQEYIEDQLQSLNISMIDIIKSFSDLINSNIELYKSYKNIPLFMELLGDEQSVVLVGKNGVGKSTLIDDLKKNSIIKTYSIPAQKILMYTKQFNDQKIEEVKKIFKVQFLKEGSEENFIINKSFNLFSELIIGIIKEHQVSKSDFDNPKESVLDRVNKHFNYIFPHLNLRTNSNEGVLLVENSLYEDIVTYGINCLSDGEKSVLFYLCSILLNDSEDIYVIDEPETHLHMALATQLWDIILDEKKGSKFIFISHNPQFILTRKNVSVLWCKSYKDIYNNDIIPIETSLSKEVILELMGTDKTILFCEGEKSSLDYQVYDRLYSVNYHIIPVGGHKKVVEYTRLINNGSITNKEAIGIIDRDLHNEQTLDIYKKDGIYHLPYNEIEMLLMEKIILQEIKAHATDKFNIENIEKDFREYLNKEVNIDKHVGYKIKYRLENEIEINNIIDKNKANSEINRILYLLEDSKTWFSQEKEKLEKIYTDPKTTYEKLLEICILKNDITKGLMNNYESYYEIRALKAIEKKEKIREYLRKKIGIPYE